MPDGYLTYEDGNETIFVTSAEHLLRLAASNLDVAVEESKRGGNNKLESGRYLRHVGRSMGVLSHLMHGLALPDGAVTKTDFSDAFDEGLKLAESITKMFYEPIDKT